jgi:hypothetical protein
VGRALYLALRTCIAVWWRTLTSPFVAVQTAGVTRFIEMFAQPGATDPVRTAGRTGGTETVDAGGMLELDVDRAADTSGAASSDAVLAVLARVLKVDSGAEALTTAPRGLAERMVPARDDVPGGDDPPAHEDPACWGLILTSVRVLPDGLPELDVRCSGATQREALAACCGTHETLTEAHRVSLLALVATPPRAQARTSVVHRPCGSGSRAGVGRRTPQEARATPAPRRRAGS